MDIEDDGTLKT